MTRALLLVVFLMSCGSHGRPPAASLDPLGDRHPGRERAVASTAPPAPAPDRGRLQHRMRTRFGDLHELHAMLARGRLDEAKALAFMLSRPLEDPGLTTAALAVSRAGSFEEARRLAPRIVAACVACHTRAGVEVLALRDQRLE
jgi:hypothetical protein